jgi:hypothetical protein
MMEFVGPAISIVALFVAVVSLLRTRNYREQQLDLQRVIADLARKQLERLNREDEAAGMGCLEIELLPHGNAHQFVVTNVGDRVVREVDFQVEPHGGGSNALVKSDYERKFPVPLLQPNGYATALVALAMGSATAYTVTLRWIEGGKPIEVETFVSL